jgi:hypothetical protein
VHPCSNLLIPSLKYLAPTALTMITLAMIHMLVNTAAQLWDQDQSRVNHVAVFDMDLSICWIARGQLSFLEDLAMPMHDGDGKKLALEHGPLFKASIEGRVLVPGVGLDLDQVRSSTCSASSATCDCSTRGLGGAELFPKNRELVAQRYRSQEGTW